MVVVVVLYDVVWFCFQSLRVLMMRTEMNYLCTDCKSRFSQNARYITNMEMLKRPGLLPPYDL